MMARESLSTISHYYQGHPCAKSHNGYPSYSLTLQPVGYVQTILGESLHSPSVSLGSPVVGLWHKYVCMYVCMSLGLAHLSDIITVIIDFPINAQLREFARSSGVFFFFFFQLPSTTSSSSRNSSFIRFLSVFFFHF